MGFLFIKASNPRDKRVAKTFMSLNCQNNHATTRINLKWNLKVKYNFSVLFLHRKKSKLVNHGQTSDVNIDWSNWNFYWLGS